MSIRITTRTCTYCHTTYSYNAYNALGNFCPHCHLPQSILFKRPKPLELSVDLFLKASTERYR